MTEVIRGTGISLTRLDACGYPVGDGVRITCAATAEFVSIPEAEPIDIADYEFPADGLKWLNLEVTFCRPNPSRLLRLIFGGRLVYSYPPKLAINGHEYNRRRRRRAR